MTMLSKIITTSKFALATLCLTAALTLSAAGQDFRVTGVTLTADPRATAAPCPVTLNFSGTITANGAGVVKYTFVRNDGATTPVSTLEFDAAGTKPLGTTWTLDLPAYEGWQAVKILSPNEMFSEKATFKLECEKKLPGGGGEPVKGMPPAGPLASARYEPCDPYLNKPMPMTPPICPDLMVAMKGMPAEADAGVDVGRSLKLIGRNLPPPPGEIRRRAAARGTRNGEARGYMIDLILSSDADMAAGPAAFSATFVDDALLRGGRVSNTLDLDAGTEKAHRVGAFIPSDTPPGKYFLCARIDPMNQIAETDENNNVTCVAIKVRNKKFKAPAK
jgi:hypothetical protein